MNMYGGVIPLNLKTYVGKAAVTVSAIRIGDACQIHFAEYAFEVYVFTVWRDFGITLPSCLDMPKRGCLGALCRV